jgi:small subunit ribosomal protein S6
MSDIDQRISTYEGMFLFPQSASADLQGAVDHITEILARGGAEIITLRKWDERRLAYDIKGNKRGIYFLSFFKAKTQQLAGIERDLRLSERLLRSLITKANHVTAEEINAHEGRQQIADEIKLRGTPAASTAAAAPAAASEG